MSANAALSIIVAIGLAACTSQNTNRQAAVDLDRPTVGPDTLVEAKVTGDHPSLRGKKCYHIRKDGGVVTGRCEEVCAGLEVGDATGAGDVPGGELYCRAKDK
jgi:uncharacterized lipoprotein